MIKTTRKTKRKVNFKTKKEAHAPNTIDKFKIREDLHSSLSDSIFQDSFDKFLGDRGDRRKNLNLKENVRASFNRDSSFECSSTFNEDSDWSIHLPTLSADGISSTPKCKFSNEPLIPTPEALHSPQNYSSDLFASYEGFGSDVNAGSGPLKEQHRKDMIDWSDRVRAQLPTFFCLEAFNSATKPVTIVSDIRRHTDMDYFTSLNITSLSVRINASDEVRMERGWVYTEGIDDVASECDLDNFKDWDFVINNDTESDVENILQNIICEVENVLKA